METQTPTALIDVLGQYGVTGVVAILCVAIVLLYRQQNALTKELRETVEKSASEVAKCQQQTLDALEKSRQALERSSEALEGVKLALGKFRYEG